MAADLALAWFHPTFHSEVGVILEPSGLCTFYVQLWPGPRWVGPRWSRELVRLPAPEHERLVEAFELGAQPDPNGICLDGCSYEIEVRQEGIPSLWQGNLAMPWPPATALAQAVVEIAEDCARWRSTRTAFAELGGYF